MKARITGQPLDPWQTLRSHQEQLAPGSFGALASFVGTLRDFNEGGAVSAMSLEHYPGMTEQHLESILSEAARQWELLDALIVHRVGAMQPGEPIVLVAAWSARRSAAFAACRYLIEELKTRAPFWKKETVAEGERWVEHNTPAD